MEEAAKIHEMRGMGTWLQQGELYARIVSPHLIGNRWPDQNVWMQSGAFSYDVAFLVGIIQENKIQISIAITSNIFTMDWTSNHYKH